MIRKGPNGISLLKLLSLKIINTTPIIAPKKKAKNKATDMFGQPKNKPIKKDSFTSPNPIQRPLDTRKIKRKNIKDPTPAHRELLAKNLKLKASWYKRTIPIAGKTTLSGMM